jgi:biopolymer transport protein ExbD
VVPKRRPAFPPIGRLRSGPFGGGKKGIFADLNLTPMIDTFTVIVIFLLQSFSASGELMFIQKNLKLPDAEKAALLNERGPVVTLMANQVLFEGTVITTADDLDEAEPGIPPLAEKLTGVREREQKMYRLDPNEPYRGNVLIQADRGTDFMLVRKAIFAVNEAGWTHIQFAVTDIQTATETAAQPPAE